MRASALLYPPVRAAVLAVVFAAVVGGCAEPAGPAPRAGSAAPSPAADSAGAGSEAGTLVYVPAYSHIYVRDARRAINLTTTLSIRNADPARALTVEAADYYDEGGRLLRRYVEGPVRLGPLATAEFVVEEDDTAGGSGASFLVRYAAEGGAAPAVVEAVMIGSAGQQGISFLSVGRIVRAAGRADDAAAPAATDSIAPPSQDAP